MGLLEEIVIIRILVQAIFSSSSENKPRVNPLQGLCTSPDPRPHKYQCFFDFILMTVDMDLTKFQADLLHLANKA